MVMARQIVMMDVRTTLPKQVRASVGAELQTPTPMVMARQIVMMDVRVLAASRSRTQPAAALEPGAQELVVPDVGMWIATRMVMARQIVLMDVRTTLPKQVRASVGAEFQTPTPMVMARQIVTIAVQMILTKRAPGAVAVANRRHRASTTAVAQEIHLRAHADAHRVLQSVEMAALNPVKRATTPMLPTATAAIQTVHQRDVVMAS
jgi:hypothetical protein